MGASGSGGMSGAGGITGCGGITQLTAAAPRRLAQGRRVQVFSGDGGSVSNIHEGAFGCLHIGCWVARKKVAAADKSGRAANMPPSASWGGSRLARVLWSGQCPESLLCNHSHADHRVHRGGCELLADHAGERALRCARCATLLAQRVSAHGPAPRQAAQGCIFVFAHSTPICSCLPPCQMVTVEPGGLTEDRSGKIRVLLVSGAMRLGRCSQPERCRV